jgi:hypothetical protein
MHFQDTEHRARKISSDSPGDTCESNSQTFARGRPGHVREHKIRLARTKGLSNTGRQSLYLVNPPPWVSNAPRRRYRLSFVQRLGAIFAHGRIGPSSAACGPALAKTAWQLSLEVQQNSNPVQQPCGRLGLYFRSDRKCRQPLLDVFRARIRALTTLHLKTKETWLQPCGQARQTAYNVRRRQHAADLKSRRRLFQYVRGPGKRCRSYCSQRVCV